MQSSQNQDVKRRSILVFFKDGPEHRASWWHFGKRFVHVMIIFFDSNNARSVSIVSQATDGIQVHLESDWLKFARCLKWMRLSGAVEIYAIESDVKAQRIGGIGWYWCHTLARDLARLPIGFVFNPWHLRRKMLKHDGKGYRIVKRYQLWAVDQKTQGQQTRNWKDSIKKLGLKKSLDAKKRLVSRLICCVLRKAKAGIHKFLGRWICARLSRHVRIRSGGKANENRSQTL